MQYDPRKRMTSAEGLQHAYCAQFHDPESEVTYANGRVAINVHDNKKLSVSKYRECVARSRSSGLWVMVRSLRCCAHPAVE